MKTAQRAWRCLARNPAKHCCSRGAFRSQRALSGNDGDPRRCNAGAGNPCRKDAGEDHLRSDRRGAAPCSHRCRSCRSVCRRRACKTAAAGASDAEIWHTSDAHDSTTRANSQLSLIGLDDLEGDGPFADGSYRLREGQCDVGKDGVLVNAVLAAQNDWQIGDAITIEAAGKTLQLSICGIFSAGNEEKQSANTLALGRIENQLYTSAEQVAMLGDAATLVRLYAVSDAPWRLDALADELQQLFGARAEITTAAALMSRRLLRWRSCPWS